MRWVTQKQFMDETGHSYKATRRRRINRILVAVWDDGRWMINIDAYNEHLEKEKLKKDMILRIKPKEKRVSLLNSHHYRGASHA